MASKEFNSILLGRTAGPQGTLTVDAKKDETFIWKPIGNEAIISSGSSVVKKNEIEKFEWLYTTKGFCLRIWKDNEDMVEYIGFKEADYDALESQITQLQLENDKPFNKVDACVTGVNWGKPAIKGNNMTMYFDNKEIFSISLADDVKNCQNIPKNSELVLEFRDDDPADKNSIQLTEIRLVCPEDTDEDGAAEDGTKEKSTEKKQNPYSAETLHEEIAKRTAFSNDTANAIASFSQTPVVIPRGKYNVDLYKNNLRLYGRTYAHKIFYKQISTLFLLPKPDEKHMYLVLSLDVPVRQGQKSHFHIVFQFDKEAKIKPADPLQLNYDPNDYPKDALSPTMSGKTYEVFAKVLRALTGKKLIGPGKYNSFHGKKGIKCSLKANEGFLFFLEKSVFFLHKPVIYLRHDEIKSIKFQRADTTGSGSRFFDLVFVLKNGKNHTFSNIDKNEYDALAEFLPSKGLNVENIISREQPNINEILGGEDDEEDDEDFVDSKSDEEAEEEEDDDEEFEKFVEEKDALQSETEALLKDAGDIDDLSSKKRKKATSSSTSDDTSSDPKSKKKKQ
ncbi:hypothetical protein C9374_006506 [Naegleria lovaniensis]|uniref:FACT complex subunit SSRP1 n=1 Tax=Naegleria lovaniensis TaxID=51637 RepID=A0AA88GNL9_NAELO|nr:uncharacterized protein C9374_006506 [Naegleria lovaniensis]KAG2381517.1 hypothetical protein C9374_006506 [Naegleria lovaniensis]